MCSATRTLEEIEQAFAKVKAAVHIEGLEIALVEPDRHGDVLTFLSEHFIPDEPISKSIGVTWNRYVESTFKDALQYNISIMAVTETGEIAGVRVIDIMTSTAPAYSVIDVESKEWRTLLTFVMHMDKEVQFCKRFSVSEVVHFVALGTSRKFRQMGIATKLLTAGVQLGKELGYKAVKGEGTSIYSQKIYEKVGFEKLAVLKYGEYQENGEFVFKNMAPEHKSTTIYGKRL